jgi:hypothetical protein
MLALPIITTFQGDTHLCSRTRTLRVFRSESP